MNYEEYFFLLEEELIKINQVGDVKAGKKLTIKY